MAAAIFAAGFGVGAERTSAKVASAALEQQQKQFEVDRKADHDAAQKALTAAVSAVTQNDRTNDILTAVRTSSQTIMEKVNHATRSNICVNSPAIRAYIDGLRLNGGGTDKVPLSNVAAH